MSNRKTGNDFEQEFCEMLAGEGFWAHNMAQNHAGQPADVIAVKDGRAYLIDCKVCEKDRFVFSRIEQNQRLAMHLWSECGNSFGWFALKFQDNSVFMVSIDKLESLECSRSSISKSELAAIEFDALPFKAWVNIWS